MATVLSLATTTNEEQIKDAAYWQAKQERAAKEKKFARSVPETQRDVLSQTNSQQLQGRAVNSNAAQPHPNLTSPRHDGTFDNKNTIAQQNTTKEAQRKMEARLENRLAQKPTPSMKATPRLER